MNEKPENNQELRTLVDAMCDDAITDDQLARLHEIIESDDEAMELYIQLIWMNEGMARLSSNYQSKIDPSVFTTQSNLPIAAEGKDDPMETTLKQPVWNKSLGNELSSSWSSKRLAELALALLVVAGLATAVFWRPADDNSVVVQSGTSEGGEDFVTQQVDSQTVERNELSDRTIVIANAGTSYEVTKPRELKLNRGELYLVVAKSGQPFVVHTASGQVRATGTRFTVSADEKTSAAVAQGTVVLSSQQGNVELGAGQQGTILADAPPTCRPAKRLSHLVNWAQEMLGQPERLVEPRAKENGLIAIDPYGQQARLSLRKYHVDVYIEDGIARTTIDQTFFNHNNWNTEGTFYFPLPPDASVSRFAMYVNGQLNEGGMVTRQRGQQIYTEILHQRRDPALLEMMEGNQFKMRIFPLEGRQEKRIFLSYTQRLDELYGESKYWFPMDHTHDVANELTIQVRVKDGAKNVDADSRTHDVDVSIEGNDLVMKYAATKIKPDQDFLLSLLPKETNADPKPEVQVAVCEKNGQHYLSAKLYPNLTEKRKPQPRQWIVLNDISASRSDIDIQAQRHILKRVVAEADDNDTMHLLDLNTTARSVSSTPVRVRDPYATRLADRQPNRLIGATNLEIGFKAVAEAIKEFKMDNPHVLYLGDGIATDGTKSAQELSRLLPGRCKFVGVGVGKKVDLSFLEQVANQTGGKTKIINPNEDIDWSVFDLLSSLNTARMSNVRVELVGDDDQPIETIAYPSSSIVSSGEALCVIALCNKTLPKKVVFRGNVDGQPVTKSALLTQAKQNADYLPRLWAKRHIEELLQSDMTSEEEIISLSKEFYVVTPYTSLIVLEDDKMYQQFDVERGRTDHWARYNAPKTIEVVKEPLRWVRADSDPANRNSQQASPNKPKTIGDIAKTLQVRPNTPFYYWSEDSNNDRWRLYQQCEQTYDADPSFGLEFAQWLLDTADPSSQVKPESNATSSDQYRAIVKQWLGKVSGPGIVSGWIRSSEFDFRGRFGPSSFGIDDRLRLFPGLRERSVRLSSIGSGISFEEFRWIDGIRQREVGSQGSQLTPLSRRFAGGGGRALSRVIFQNGMGVDLNGDGHWSFLRPGLYGYAAINGDDGYFDADWNGIAPAEYYAGFDFQNVFLQDESGQAFPGFFRPTLGDVRLDLGRQSLRRGPIKRRSLFSTQIVSVDRSPTIVQPGLVNVLAADYLKSRLNELKNEPADRDTVAERETIQAAIAELQRASTQIEPLSAYWHNSDWAIQPRPSTVPSPTIQFYRGSSMTFDLSRYADGLGNQFSDLVDEVLRHQPNLQPQGAIADDAKSLLRKSRQNFQPVSVRFTDDGNEIFVGPSGQFATTYRNQMRLKGRLVCDGKHIIEQYDELGVAARRTASKLRLAALERAIPHLAPSAQSLTMRFNVELVEQDDQSFTLKLTRLKPDSSTTAANDDANETSEITDEIHQLLTLDYDGRIVRRQFVRGNETTATLSYTYDNDEVTVVLDASYLPYDRALAKNVKPNRVKLMHKKSYRAAAFTPDENTFVASLDQKVVFDMPLRVPSFYQQKIDELQQADDQTGDGEPLTPAKLAGRFKLSDCQEVIRLRRHQVLSQLQGKHFRWRYSYINAHHQLVQLISELHKRLKQSPLAGDLMLYGATWHDLDAVVSKESKASLDPVAMSIYHYHDRNNLLGTAITLAKPDGLLSHLAQFTTASIEQTRQARDIFRRKFPNSPLTLALLFQTSSNTRVEELIQLNDQPQWSGVALQFAAAVTASDVTQREKVSDAFWQWQQSLSPDTEDTFLVLPTMVSVLHCLRATHSEKLSEYLGQRLEAVEKRDSLPLLLSFAEHLHSWGEPKLAARAFAEAQKRLELDSESNTDSAALLKRFALAQAAWAGGQYQLAWQQYEAILETLREKQIPISPALLAASSRLAQLAGETADAIALEEQAMAAEEPYLPDAINLAGFRQRYQRLWSQYESLARQHASNQKGDAQELEKLIARAQQTWDRWSDFDRDNLDLPTKMANLLALAERNEEAWEYLSSSIDRKPRDASSYFSLGQWYLAHDDLEGAERWLREAPQWDTANPRWIYEHAIVLKKLGRKTEATKQLKRVTDGQWAPGLQNWVTQAKSALREQ